MVEITPPVFVCGDGDVSVFMSIKDALAFVEPWDVDEDLEVFDSRGTRLVFRAEGVDRTRFTVGGGETLLDKDSSGESGPGALATFLRDFLQAVGVEQVGWDDRRLQSAPFEDLVTTVADKFGADRRRGWWRHGRR